MSGVMIRYGTGDDAIEFKGNEIRNVRLTQALNPLSSQIEISTCDFTLDSNRNIDFSFKKREPLSIFFDDKLKATMFVKTAKRKSKNIWDIQSEDYIGVLDNIPFPGGVYHGLTGGISLLSIILANANIPCKFSLSQDVAVYGHIPYTTCREAIMQIAFACGWIIDTSDSDVLTIRKLDDEISQNIPLSRILQGQNFDEESEITAVEVTAHLYEASTDLQGMEKVVLYDASKNGAGQNIKLMFDKPMYTISITGGELLENSANHAIFNISDGGTLIGYQYNYTAFRRTKVNPSITDSGTENIISVENATLVSLQNVDEVLERCYNHYVNGRKINLKIVEGKHEREKQGVKYGEALYGTFLYGSPLNSSRTLIRDSSTKVGDVITCETEYLGTLQGRIIKQTFNLNGGIIIKDTEMWQGG